MKFTLTFLGLLAVVGPLCAWEIPNLGRGELHKDLQEFVDLLPIDKILEIVLEYVAEDEEVQNVVVYMQSEDFRKLVMEVESLPEIIDLMNYIYDAGVDIYYLVNKLNEFVGAPALTPPQTFNISLMKITGGLAGLEKDILAVLPTEELKKLYDTKLETSPAFKELITRLSSPEFQKVVDTVYLNPEFQRILQKAKDAGVNVEALWNLIQSLLGLRLPKPFVYNRF